MVAIKKTNTVIHNANLVNDSNVHVYIARKVNARQLWINWQTKHEILWAEYSIKETDMRQKTATLSTPQPLDLTTGQYCVLITAPDHEDFSGVFMSNEYTYNNETGLYDYQLQDHSRNLQSKVDMIVTNTKLHALLKNLMTRGFYPIKGATKKQKKEWKRVLSGIRPAYQYEQRYYGSTFKDNPMEKKYSLIIRNKSRIEAIRDLVFGTGMYVDVYFDKYGVLQIEPYHKNDLYNTGLYLTTPEIASAKYKFDTTNILTDVVVQSSDTNKIGTKYTSASLLNLDLTAIFGSMVGMISNPNQNTKSTTASNKTGKSNSSKKSKDTKNKNNPYGTKKKEVWVCMDRSSGSGTDKNFLNNVCKELRKNGWKTHNCGVGSNTHTTQRSKAKNGVFFCIFNGVDPGTLREYNASYYMDVIERNNCRVVVGWHGVAVDIRKGGRAYKYIGKAWDDNYSGRNTGLRYPLNYLTKLGVPSCYSGSGYNYKKLVSVFLAGGDNPEACNKPLKMKRTGYMKNLT